ncbi:MAG: histidinol-phosphatase [Bacteroidetes bacterium]|jgi:tyrosine-protein phosphatase YwqE|nr:histidinol-phosphatase [Bacteroidota bacterium]
MFSFLTKKKYAPKDSLEFVKMDMHNHLLPGVDDGAKNITESLNMIRVYIEMGWDHIVATPHMNEAYYPNQTHKLRQVFANLQNEVSMRNLPIELELAAEYQTDDLFRSHLEADELLCLQGKRVLIELPFFHPPLDWEQYFFETQMKGYTPILAHAERYLYWINDLEKFDTLQQRGVEFQLNLTSLIGKYGPEVQALAKKLLKREAYRWVASDAHSVNDLNQLRDQLPQKWPVELNTLQYKNNVQYTS